MNAPFFSHNRSNVTSKLDGGLLVLSAYCAIQRSNDTAFKFEQESNFWYFCGIEEPNWLLIVDGLAGKSWLVAPETNEVHKTFDGSLDYGAAKDVSGVDRVLSHDEGQDLLKDLAKRHSVAYTVFDSEHASRFNFSLNPALSKNKRTLERIFSSVRDCQKDIAALRAIKQPVEVEAIKKAVDLTVDAFEQVRSSISSFNYEYEVESSFTHYFRSRGATGHAYDPIVAGGLNACTLHYVKNNDKLSRRQFVLLDIGARKNGYSADITRTYALGNPTKRQQAVHDAVQQAQERVIEIIKPFLSFSEYQEKADKIMMEALLSLGLAKSVNDTEALHRYMPHAISHGLGVDVHDSLGDNKMFLEYMVLTVEPGIYIPEESIGVRIEDDVLVTNSGHNNISAKLSTAW
ncbi:aminopeptidase P N-terminal domain-containing protein [Candidatus Nomurabacteria bacterium]|nr:aminopeptidase P N-terminal domain-containing protein [Candidatus Nomurabacteria bacterium]